MTKIEKLEYYIQATKEKTVYSPSQQENKQVVMDRPKVLLKLGIRYDSIGTDK